MTKRDKFLRSLIPAKYIAKLLIMEDEKIINRSQTLMVIKEMIEDRLEICVRSLQRQGVMS